MESSTAGRARPGLPAGLQLRLQPGLKVPPSAADEHGTMVALITAELPGQGIFSAAEPEVTALLDYDLADLAEKLHDYYSDLAEDEPQWEGAGVLTLAIALASLSGAANADL